MMAELVRDWMTPDPITVSPDTLLTEVFHLMKDRSIRRLPVVKEGKLVGIVTWGDVRKASASDVPSLSRFEANELLDRVKVKRIMARDLITISPQVPVTTAAEIMLEHKIGGLPVMENDQLVGLITGSDIFRMLTAGTGKAA